MGSKETKEQGKGVRRNHKRSILKHNTKEGAGDKSKPGSSSQGVSLIKTDRAIKPNNMKVKFAGSLRND